MEKPFEVTNDFYIAVGCLTVAWATIEVPLDPVAGIIFTRTTGATRYEREIPRSFERKVSFCKKCFNNLPELSAFQPGASELLQKALDLSEIRHRLVHGLVDNFTPVPESKIILRRILYEKYRHLVEEHHTTIDEIRSATDQATDIGHDMGELAWTLADFYRIG